MYDDPVLLNDWHPVAHISSISQDNLTPARVMGVDLVVWQSDDGVHVWQDRCAHRGVKLSLGKRCENRLGHDAGLAVPFDDRDETGIR